MPELLQAVSTVGFPIVCCGAMFYLMLETNKAHKSEAVSLAEAINNNTLAITKLIVTLGEE